MTTPSTASSVPWRAFVGFAAAVLLLVGLTGTALAHGSSPEGSSQRGQALGRMAPGLGAELAQVRAATARYHDVEAAMDDGYVEATPCVAHPFLGTMGYHYVNFGLIEEPLDPRRPEALLYVPGPSGQLRLVGVEYLSPDPHAQLFGQNFTVGPAGPALHVWVWQANPSGMFADFNPNVSC